MVQLDRANIQILRELQRNGRSTVSDLARLTDRGESTVRERLIALERAGVIEGYAAHVNARLVGFDVRAIVRADCEPARVQQIARALAAVPNVVRASLSTGPKPLRIEMVAADSATLERTIEQKLGPLNLHNVEVAIIRQELVKPRALPIGSVEETEATGDIARAIVEPATTQGRRDPDDLVAP